MKFKDSILKHGKAVAFLLAAATSSRAQVTMSVYDPNSGATIPGTAYTGSSFCASSGLSAIYDGNSVTPIIPAGAYWIGVYAFSVSPEPNSSGVPNPLYSVCLSPMGDLPDGAIQYNVIPFNNLGAGSSALSFNSPTWAGSTAAANYANYGLLNANYIYNYYFSGILNNTSGLQGSQADQGAALAMAMYAALYNSTALALAANGNSSSTGGFDASFANTKDGNAMSADFNTMLAFLNSVSASTITTQGGNADLLEPQLSSSQEFELDVANGNGIPVPDSSTFLAGSLILLPLGASTLRNLRNKKKKILA